MVIRETSEEGVTVFETPPAGYSSNAFREAEDLFSSMPVKHSLVSKGGHCKREQATEPEGADLVIHKMFVPWRSRLREVIVKGFEREGHTVRSNAT